MENRIFSVVGWLVFRFFGVFSHTIGCGVVFWVIIFLPTHLPLQFSFYLFFLYIFIEAFVVLVVDWVLCFGWFFGFLPLFFLFSLYILYRGWFPPCGGCVLFWFCRKEGERMRRKNQAKRGWQGYLKRPIRIYLLGFFI